jgi:hypothetical protein
VRGRGSVVVADDESERIGMTESSPWRGFWWGLATAQCYERVSGECLA